MKLLSGCDSYVLLIVFSYLDPKTLFRSCSLVCRNWYSLFFSAPSSDEEENFNSSLIKICYLNTTSQRLELHRQFGDFYANNGSKYTQFDEIKWDFVRGGSLKLFHQLLKMENGRKPKNTKKMLTINRECELIPYHREAMESIRQFQIGEGDYRVSSIDILEANNFDHGLTVYYPFMVYADKSELKIISLVSGKEFCSHSFNSNYVIKQVELKFHSQMQQHYKSKLQIDGKCYIYSLYILACNIHQSHSIKRFLLIDQLFGEVKLVEDCTFMEEPLTHWGGYNIKVGDWDTNTMDVVLLSHENLFTLFLEDGYKITFVSADDYNNNPYVPRKGEYPIISMQLPSWKPGCLILDTNIVNITKPLMKEGISLIDSKKYSTFSVFEVKICYQKIDVDFESEIFCNSVYILLAKKNGETIEANPYSIMWKICNRKGFDAMFKTNGREAHNPTSTHYPEIKDLTNMAYFLDQGRKLKLITGFYAYINTYTGDVYESDYWDYVYYTKVYPSWSYIDSDSIGNFEEDELKQRITKEISRRNWKIVGHVEDNFYLLLNYTADLRRFTISVCIVNYDNIKKMINKKL